jgi:hypothetical protein
MKDDLLYRTRRRKRARRCDDETTEPGISPSSAIEKTKCSGSSLDVGLSCSMSPGHSKDSAWDLGYSDCGRIIVLRQDEAPAHKLTLKLINMQSCLKDINERIMAGMVVPTEDWMALRRLSAGLASTFAEEVEFAWEMIPHQTTKRASECSWSHDVSVFVDLPVHDDAVTAASTSDL